MKEFGFKILFLIIGSVNVFSQMSLRKEHQDIVKPFVEAFIRNDKEEIVNFINYPLQRQYPIPYIYNKHEMIERFSQVFDENLTNMIINSSVETDWHDVGWRGIMMGNGLIWIDYDGKLHAINYQSLQEKEMRNNIILELKNNLPESLREFKEPCLLCETKTYILRIDLLDDNNYRLAAWTKKNKKKNINIVLTNGEKIFDGSG